MGVTHPPAAVGVTRDDIAEADRQIAAGQPLEDAGDHSGALGCYQRAIDSAPGHARAWMNLGNALAHLQRWDEARTAFEKAVECAPEHAPAHFNLGSLLLSRGDLAGAVAVFTRALELAPDMARAALMLADAQEAHKHFREAEEAFRRALRIDPQYAGAMLNFGSFLLRQGRMEEALNSWLRAKTLDPLLPPNDPQLLFAMNFSSEHAPTEIADAHFRIGRAMSDAAGVAYASWPNIVDPDRRLRIGYVSGDFGPHPVAIFMRPVLEEHDRSRFEVFCYSNAPDDATISPILRARADHWVHVEALSDEALAERFRSDRIDILVDLAGHTHRGRLAAFARHPAPVQLTWLGYLNTTGLPAIDYRITDSITDPAGETEVLHSERLIRMPHSQWCYFAWHEIDVVEAPHRQRPEAVVFGSFNQAAKLTDATLALWSRVLAAAPGSELVVLDVRHDHARAHLASRMTRHGIDTARVTFRKRVPITEYFNAIGNVDVALDTVPYNGATTALDVLWMGVPVVALRGDRGIARGTASVLRTLGANDLVAETADEYVGINARLASDRRSRDVLRTSLRPRLLASPLMDARGFTADLERSYLAMWSDWCAARRGTPAGAPASA